jgi:signal transduction histidine kinase
MPTQRHWGCLSISSDAEDGYVRVRVHDSGHGIPERDLPHIFDPFFSHKHQGMGLGLTISQSVIESFGGTIRADNHPDGGAVFCFELPAITASQPQRKTRHDQDHADYLPG